MRTSLDVAMAKSPTDPATRRYFRPTVRASSTTPNGCWRAFSCSAEPAGTPDDQTTVALARSLLTLLIPERMGPLGRPDAAAATFTTAGRRQPNTARPAGRQPDRQRHPLQPAGRLVHVTTTAEGPSARLIVENSGPVLDPAEVGQLGRPFRRGGAERTGSDDGAGLGLAIVAAIVDATAEPRTRGADGKEDCGSRSPSLARRSPVRRRRREVLVVEDQRRLADDTRRGPTRPRHGSRRRLRRARSRHQVRPEPLRRRRPRPRPPRHPRRHRLPDDHRAR